MTTYEPIVLPGDWHFSYRYFAGDAASRFFHELRDRQRIMGTRCPQCRRVLVPARSFCDACYVETTDWVPVADEGVVETFTILTAALPGLPEPPWALGYVTLDGADTAILNRIDVDLSDVEEAARRLLGQPRVKVVFAAEREGRITDFTFRLVDGT